MSKKKSLPQYVLFETDDTHEMSDEIYPDVHCPLCGHVGLATPKKSGEKPCPPCDHLTFVYSNESFRFIYTSKDFKNRCKKSGIIIDDDGGVEDGADASDFDEDMEEILPKIGYDENLLVVEITYPIYSCGSMCGEVADIYGFDCGTLLNKKILADRSDSLLRDALFLGKVNIEPARQKSEKSKVPAKPSKTTKRPVPKKKTKAASKIRR